LAVNLAAPIQDSEQTNKAAMMLSAAVHLLLIGALFFGVQWKSHAPSTVEVDVWRSAPLPTPVIKPEPVPEPPKPEPKPEPKPIPKVEPPPPLKPDIAIKDDKRPKKEEPKPPEPKREEPDWKKELAREQKQLDQQKAVQDQRTRAAAEANQLSQLKAEQASAARNRGLADYASKIRGKIKGNTSITGLSIQGNPQAIFKVTQLPSGEVLTVKLSKSSGNKLLDDAIERGILKSSPLPLPDQQNLFQRELELKYKPFDE
jgi:colicin import membrane protein